MEFGQRISMFEPVDAIKTLFALVIILCINILEAFSYGILIFPPLLLSQLSPRLSPLDGIYMFIQSTAVSQLIYALFSSFSGGLVGGMMVENIPFMSAISLHILAQVSDKERVISTVLVAYSISTLMIAFSLYGIWFLKLDRYFKLLPQFFLDGLLAGIGVFLLITAGKIIIHPIEGFRDSALSSTTSQLIVAFAMGMVIFAVQFRYPSHSFNIPLVTLSFILGFYAVAFGLFGFNWEQLSTSGWLFRFGENASVGGGTGFFHYFSLLQLNQVEWKCIWQLIPTLVASTIFGVLHLPINIPAFAWSISQTETFSFGQEVFCHAVSNAAGAFLGLLPNYLVYTTSGLFWRIGGNSKAASFALALLTFAIPLFGTKMMRAVPKVVLTSLMVYLGIDLVWYAGIVPAKNSKSRLEQSAIGLICAVSNVFGFEFGLLVGAILSLWIVAYRAFSQVSCENCTYLPLVSGAKTHYSPQLATLINAAKREKTTCIQIVGNLFWPTSESTVRKLEGFLPGKEFVIVDLTKASLLDDSFIKAVEGVSALCSSAVQIVLCLPKNVDERWLGFSVRYFYRIEECVDYWETCFLSTLPAQIFQLQYSMLESFISSLAVCHLNQQPAAFHSCTFTLFEEFEVCSFTYCLVVEGSLWEGIEETFWECGSLFESREVPVKLVVVKEAKASVILFPVGCMNMLPSEYW